MAFLKKEFRDKEVQLDKKKQEDVRLVEFVYRKFTESHRTKAPLMKKWEEYIEAYNNEYFERELKPDYKTNHISNFIFSTIETIRPIMTDNNPKFIALPRTPEGAEKADKIQIALDSEWDREQMDIKLPKALLPTLQIGNIILGCLWDGNSNKGIGDVKTAIINPFNMFVDPSATNFEDAEYAIYATYKSDSLLKKSFPDKASLLEGSDVKYRELVANRELEATYDNQILVLEAWVRDYTMTEYEEETKEKDGEKVKKTKMKYPRGRVITCCPELGILLSDKQNPYKDGKFPFVIIKDYDIPFQFWGEGEIHWLLSPQKQINDLNNQVIDNAKLTANQIWVIDKNAGIGKGNLSNRPGLVVRKNPGSHVERPAPPPLPGYVNDKILELKQDMETISGVHDVTQGRRAIGVTAGNAIMALQEAGQARIRLKVKLMETALAELATMWYSRIQQFWLLDRDIRTVDKNEGFTVDTITKDDLQHDFDIVITAGSTMPSNKTSMLDLMIRLAQTPAEDGLPMVDRESVLEFIPVGDKRSVLKRFENIKQEQQEMQMMQQQQAEQQQIEQSQMQQSNEQQIAQEEQIYSQLVDMIEQMQQQINELNMKINSSSEDETIEEENVEGNGSDVISDELLSMIDSLSDEELQILLEKYPELKDILG